MKTEILLKIVKKQKIIITASYEFSELANYETHDQIIKNCRPKYTFSSPRKPFEIEESNEITNEDFTNLLDFIHIDQMYILPKKENISILFINYMF